MKRTFSALNEMRMQRNIEIGLFTLPGVLKNGIRTNKRFKG